MTSKDQLSKQLQDLGITSSEVVMVHASLRKLGPIEERANGVIDSVLSALSPGGTMLMVLGSKAGDPFDFNKSPADPEMGILAEVMRQRPDSVCSDHPAARFCAIGSHALQLFDRNPFHDYYSDGSVIDRLCHLGGKILRLAADLDSTTATHYAEYKAKVHPKKRVRRAYLLKDRTKVHIESLDDCEGIQKWKDGDYFSQILIDYLKTEAVSFGKVGNCNAELFPATDFVRFATAWMEDNLDSTLC